MQIINSKTYNKEEIKTKAKCGMCHGNLYFTDAPFEKNIDSFAICCGFVYSLLVVDETNVKALVKSEV